MITVLLALALQDLGPTTLPPCTQLYAEVISEGEASLPAIGDERTADVGEPLLVSSQYRVLATGSTLAETLTVSGNTSRAPFTLTIPAGTTAVLEAPGYRLSSFVFEGRGPQPTDVHLENANSGRPVARISWGWAKERHPVTRGSFGLDHRECVSVPRDSLTRQLAFTGVSRGVVSLEYREFSGDLARPAFTQAATYDLAEGTTVGFRGARIEVLNADNTGIRYRVLRTFD